MTGEEHYLDAERHLTYAADASHGSPDERYHLARAQVHATLALAAAHMPGTVEIRTTSEPLGVAGLERVTEVVRTERVSS